MKTGMSRRLANAFCLIALVSVGWLGWSHIRHPGSIIRRGELGNFDRVAQAAGDYLIANGRAAESVAELAQSGYLQLPLLKQDGSQVRFIEPSESFAPGDLLYLPALRFHSWGPDEPTYHLILFGEPGVQALPQVYLDLDADGRADPIAEMTLLIKGKGGRGSFGKEPVEDTLERLGFWTAEHAEVERDKSFKGWADWVEQERGFRPRSPKEFSDAQPDDQKASGP